MKIIATKKDDEPKNYQVRTIYVKEGHNLYSYFEEMSRKSKNLYNTTNYHIRQSYFRLICKKDHPNTQEVIRSINSVLPEINEKRIQKVNKDGNPLKPFSLLTEQTPFMSERVLDAVFRKHKNIDFISMPAHVNYLIIKDVFQSWKSYYASKKDYKKHPSKYTGKPKPPKYKKNGFLKSFTFSNINCKFKEDGETIRFPKTKATLKVGKLEGKLKEVGVSYDNGQFQVSIVTELPYVEPKQLNQKRSIGIDLGVNNFAAISNNFNEKPIIIKGKEIKHINYLYNKNRAKYYSKIRQGKKHKEGIFKTKRLNNITLKRNHRIKDYMHKVSTAIINYCVKNNTGVIVVGQNKGWKQGIDIGKKNNQNFTQIPYYKFVQMLELKAKNEGITLVKQEESYTSKASFLDKDIIPVYSKENKEKHKFSGSRKTRGLYISSFGVKLNADLNGSYNILRKHIGDFEATIGKICNPKIVKNVLAGCRTSLEE